MNISESGQKIVDQTTRQTTHLVQKIEQLEAKTASMTATFAEKEAAMLEEWKNQVADIQHERDVVKAELIDRNARLDVAEGQGSLLRAELDALTRAHNAQTAELDGLRHDALAFGKRAEIVLGKNSDAEQAERSLHQADEIEGLLSRVPDRQPHLVQTDQR